MQTRVYVFLCFMMALFNGTGLYKISALLSNLLYGLFLLVFVWDQYKKYYQNKGLDVVSFDTRKCIILFLYFFNLCFFLLREVVVDSDNSFNANEGILRQYGNLIRGIYAFVIVVAAYNVVKNARVFVILPVLCLVIMLIGLFLESQHLINFNADVHPDSENEQAIGDKLLERPGGFLNANMTAALAILWLYVALESKLRTPLVLKVLALILTLVVCSLTQSRAAIVFLVIYITYNSIVRRNINLIMVLVFGGLFLIAAAQYFDMDIASELMDKLASRSDSKEDSAQERLGLIMYALNAFYDAPLMGNGLYYVAKTSGASVSSHNQILEILTNWGLLGFAMMLILYMTFYHKNSFSYLTLCIFPTLLFSHNFFEGGAIQASLAFAYSTTYKRQT